MYAVALVCVLYPTFVYISKAETEQRTCANISARDLNIRYLLTGASGSSWIFLLTKNAGKLLYQKNMSVITHRVNVVVGALISVHLVSEIYLLFDCSTNIDVFGIVSPKSQWAEWASTVPLM